MINNPTMVEHHMDIVKYWQETGGDNLLKGYANFAELFASLPNHEQAFILKDHIVRCMDERTPGGKRRAGSGILDKNAVSTFKGIVDGLTAHDLCGAAGLYVKEHGIETDDADTVAEEKIKEMAHESNVPFSGRISQNQMMTLAGEYLQDHFARVFYYADVDFDPSVVPGMPVGFVLSRDLISISEQAVREGKIGLSIAFGHHSLFNEKFSSEEPFYLVGVLPDNQPETKEKVEKELEQIKGDHPAVRIDFIVRE